MEQDVTVDRIRFLLACGLEGLSLRSMWKVTWLILVLFLCDCGKSSQDQGQNIRYVIAPSGLNLRAQASPASPAVKLLRVGAEVTVVEEQKEESSWQGLTGRWTKVRFEQTEGWAFGAFLSKQKPPRATGTWGTCVEMPNSLALNFRPDGSYSSVSIGVETIGRYTEEGDTVTIVGTHVNHGATYGGTRALEPGPAGLMRLAPNGQLCFADGECLCRR
ncbi:MAG: SH3 domain-containing protein [Leptospirales bacterium]|nr:SH3 domain-containing protein [Leptospirales bacterium]